MNFNILLTTDQDFRNLFRRSLWYSYYAVSNSDAINQLFDDLTKSISSYYLALFILINFSNLLQDLPS